MITATTTSADAITRDHLAILFAVHCECRPLDVDRTEDDHSHDCDTGILDDVQTALNAADDDEVSAAKLRCAEHWNRDLESSVYRPLLVAYAEPPTTHPA